MLKMVLYDIAGGKVFCDYFSVVLPSSEDLFSNNEGELFLKTMLLGTIKILSTRTFQMHQIREFISCTENGDPDVKSFANKLVKNYGKIEPTDTLVHVSVKYLIKEFINMDPLITEWWRQQKSHQ